MDLSTCTQGQRESIRHLEGPLFIAAGAGSGKTFTLQNRIVYALSDESGPALSSVDEVLAITFMEKAAAEIKSRVRTALRAEGRGDEALKVDAAWISTIHGMCARILRENALEAGIDPAFEVLSEFDARILRRRALDRVLAREQSRCAQGAAGSAVSELFREFGVEPRGLNDTTVLSMIEKLLDVSASFSSGLDAVEFCRAFPSPGEVARRLYEAYRAVLEHAEAVNNPKKPKARVEEALRACAESMDALEAFMLSKKADAAELGRILRDLGTIHGATFGRSDEAGKEAVLAVSESLDWAQRNLNALFASRHADALTTLAKKVDAEYQGMLDEAGALDNNGLLHRTRALLDEDPAVAKRYQGRFKLVMVDEFQDTNRLQLSLIEKVAGSDRLCTVGDAQQSIYRFNGADVSVFEDQRKRVQEAAACGLPALATNLDANFRSHADVLAFVRAVCGRDWVFGDGFLDLAAARKERGLYKGEGPRIELQVLSYEGGKEASCVVEAEAAFIAERFAALRKAGHRAGEMVVLMGTTRNAGIYADALRERGFECVVGGGRSFFELPEVRLVCNLATALADPADSEALFAVLTSPFLRLSADDFLALGTRRDEGRLFRRRIQEPLLAAGAGCEQIEREEEEEGFSEPLRFALGLFSRAFSLVKRERPSRVLAGMIADSGWLMRLEEEGTRGSAVAANVFKVMRMVEDLERKPGYGMARVARDLREAARTLGESPASLSVANQDAVRLMTIHKSKGLEFPIVAVSSYEPYRSASETFAATAVGDRVLVALSAKEGRCEANGGKSISHGFAPESCVNPDEARDAAEFACAVRAYDWAQELAEAQRKFYVACTRASEYLLVSGLLPAGSKKSGEPFSYARNPILHDVKCGVLGVSGEFPESSCTVELDSGGHRFEVRIERACFSKEEPFGGSVGGVFRKEAALQGVSAVSRAGSDAGAAAFAEDCVSASGLEATSSAASEAGAFSSGSNVVRVPVIEHSSSLRCVPASAREGVFSYSAVAPHEDHLPTIERDDFVPASSSGASVSVAFLGDEEGGSCAEELQAPSATDVGSAFHRLAQLAVLLKPERGCLALPPEASVDAVARGYRIEGRVRERLDAALGRWFASDAARFAEGFSRVRAEVPFMVPVSLPRDGGGRSGDDHGERVRYLEGEIDLLAETEDGRRAFVVDYKTGGSPGEPSERLREKHLLQASCYAYALLLSRRFEQVDFAFVRVEQEDSAASGQPQVVPYSFAADDLPALEEVVAGAYLAAGRS